MSRRLVYTAVFGGYDLIYPPMVQEENTDYIIFTDNPEINVPIWHPIFVDIGRFKTKAAANRYHKFLIHRIAPGYSASLYLDGNIRLIGPTAPLFAALDRSGAEMALWRHSVRRTVAEEVQDVILTGKVPSERAWTEYETYRSDGFPDVRPLAENTIMVRDHRAPRLDKAMALWWSLYEAWLSRDQLSFNYAVWKSGLELHYFPGTFREPNPYVAVYPHLGKGDASRLFAHVSARSNDSRFYLIALHLWKIKWYLQRRMRAIMKFLNLRGSHEK